MKIIKAFITWGVTISSDTYVETHRQMPANHLVGASD
jgi:hypothetical protein